jgi:hypothetical protein
MVAGATAQKGPLLDLGEGESEFIKSLFVK